MRWLVFFIKFVFLAAFFIISNGNLHLAIDNERQQFYEEYQTWAFNVLSSVGDLTGYVIQVEWMPDSNTDVEIIKNSEDSEKPRFTNVKR